jgi:hypothetical protein
LIFCFSHLTIAQLFLNKLQFLYKKIKMEVNPRIIDSSLIAQSAGVASTAAATITSGVSSVWRTVAIVTSIGLAIAVGVIVFYKLYPTTGSSVAPTPTAATPTPATPAPAAATPAPSPPPAESVTTENLRELAKEARERLKTQ